MLSLSVVLIFVNLLFLTLGAMLYLYADHIQLAIPSKTDQLYPTIALEHLSPLVGVLFVIGLIAAAYSSADSALTSLTTSFCVDFLGMKSDTTDAPIKRKMVHIAFSIILVLVIQAFHNLDDDAVVNKLFKVAGYTYGPILGLFSFSIMTSRSVTGWPVMLVCLIAPVISYLVDDRSAAVYEFQWGYMILLLNGILTFLGLLIISSLQRHSETI